MKTPKERLQKLIAAAGIASRRAAEALILEGRVTVNGTVVTELGTRADPAKDHVKVDGKSIRPAIGKAHRYVLLNKPRGVMVTLDDPAGRPTVRALLGGRVSERIVPVGRLDFDSEGLLILTDDGALVQKLAHPSGGCTKEYDVKVSGIPTPSQLERLSRGIVLEGERTRPARIELVKTTPEKNGIGGNAWLKIVLGEGRSRQIRRMLDHVGHPVAKLRRVAIGPLRDRSLRSGQFRELTEDEVRALFAFRAEPLGTPAERPRRSAPLRSKAPAHRPRPRTGERA